MTEASDSIRALGLAAVVVAAVVGGAFVVTEGVLAQSIPDAADMASASGETTQDFTVDYQLLGGMSFSCTVDTSPVTSKGVDVLSVSISGEHPDHSISASVTSSGDIDVSATDTDSDSEGSQSMTVTVTADTSGVTAPSQGRQYDLSCGGIPVSEGSAHVQAVQAGTFDIKDTGIQDTNATRIHADDGSIENGTTLTQSIDLDLVVPDDGDGDGDTFTVTVDTGEARAAGIDVAGAAVESDPSGPDGAVEVVNTTVTPEGNVTLTIREAAADRDDGHIAQEAITVAVDLDATSGISADDAIDHVIADGTGNTTATVTFESTGGTANRSIERAIAGSDGVINTGEILTAIDHWATGDTVPNTGGKTIDTGTILNLIDTWARGGQV